MRQQANGIHKKRFGQYFSGRKVADMLFGLLPKDKQWKTVIDPMAGTGDMLVSVRDNLDECPKMLGVEIDDAISQECKKRVPEAVVLCEDAFKSKAILFGEKFDLVITNPPYVRYQLQKEKSDVMPSAQDVRRNLIHQIHTIPNTSEEERHFFLSLAKNYSGLSDMAVPSWILCSMLVKKDGYLAVVVPDTWLNRDYANPIQYLLMKLFQIDTIARDTNSNWFSDALVKTCLVVAKRVEMQKLCDKKMFDTRVLEAKHEYWKPAYTIFPHIKDMKESKWMDSGDIKFFSQNTHIPYEVSEIIGENNSIEYITLADMGIDCGQGLRTGANDFFYVKIENNNSNEESLIVKSNPWDFGGKNYSFTKADIIPTLQNRREIDGLIITADKLKTAVVYPQHDIQGDLQIYITSAEQYRDSQGRMFKDFSAVRPNEKKDGDKIIREWFRLPTMANRHIPNLCISRVSAKIPECLYVQQHESVPIVVDANMVTLWGGESHTVYSVMSILNSTWSRLSLELICTVMGGGALKIEATHLRKLLIPRLSDEQLKKLEICGISLINNGKMTASIQHKIDEIMAFALKDVAVTDKMHELLMHKYAERRTRQ